MWTWAPQGFYNLVMSNVIKVDPEILGGTPCFAGTRVPVDCFLDALSHSRGIDYFLEQYPTVEREQVVNLLSEFKSAVTPNVAAR